MASIQERALEELNALYEIHNAQEVLHYLTEYPELEDILIEAHSQILKYFGEDAHANIKLEHDIEESFETLFVYVVSALAISDATDRLHLMDEEWFVKEMPRLNGSIVFDVEF